MTSSESSEMINWNNDFDYITDDGGSCHVCEKFTEMTECIMAYVVGNCWCKSCLSSEM